MGETRNGNGTGKMVAALASLALIFGGEVAGVVIGMVFDLDLDLAATVAGALVAVGAIFALGGRRWLTFDKEAFFEAWKFMWWIVAISAVLMAWDLYDYLAAGEAVHPGWALRCLSSLVLCLAIGVNEEGMFRGALFGGLLARVGEKKNGIWWAVVISSVAFGCAHISLDDLDPSSWLTYVQALLKICQTGMYAVMLCAVVLKTQDLLGAMMIHAFDDWLLFVVSTGLYGESFETDYVTPDPDEALYTTIFYLIIIALYLPTFIKAIRELRRIQAPQRGPFVQEVEPMAYLGEGAYQGQPYAEGAYLGQPYAMPGAVDAAGPYGQAPYGQDGQAPYGQAPYGQAPYGQDALQPSQAPQGYDQAPYQQGAQQDVVPQAQQAYAPYAEQGTWQQAPYQQGAAQQWPPEQPDVTRRPPAPDGY